MGYTPPHLEVRKVTGGWSVFAPSSTSTDDLRIYANTTDTFGQIKIDGLGTIYLYPQTGYGVVISPGGTGTFELVNDSANTQAKLTSNISNHDLFLATTGAGVLKFGTYSAGAATDSTGYVTIKDAGGTTRKLMVQA